MAFPFIGTRRSGLHEAGQSGLPCQLQGDTQGVSQRSCGRAIAGRPSRQRGSKAASGWPDPLPGIQVCTPVKADPAVARFGVAGSGQVLIQR